MYTERQEKIVKVLKNNDVSPITYYMVIDLDNLIENICLEYAYDQHDIS